MCLCACAEKEVFVLEMLFPCITSGEKSKVFVFNLVKTLKTIPPSFDGLEHDEAEIDKLDAWIDTLIVNINENANKRLQ